MELKIINSNQLPLYGIIFVVNVDKLLNLKLILISVILFNGVSVEFCFCINRVEKVTEIKTGSCFKTV